MILNVASVVHEKEKERNINYVIPTTIGKSFEKTAIEHAWRLGEDPVGPVYVVEVGVVIHLPNLPDKTLLRIDYFSDFLIKTAYGHGLCDCP